MLARTPGTLPAGNSWRSSAALQMGLLQPLGEIRQRGGKRVHAFAVNGDLDVQTVASNTFEIEWPPKSGRLQTFPEVDRAEWFTLPIARTKILEGQRPLLDRLEKLATAN